MTFKPLLASPVDTEQLRYPVLVSPKLDGIRAISLPGRGLVSRTLKPIPNEFIRSTPVEDYLDGEILTYTDGQVDSFNVIQSKVMSRTGEPDWKLVAFDHCEFPTQPFVERHRRLADGLEHFQVDDFHQLMHYEAQFVARGYEGMMIRSPEGVYKYGRSSAKEQILLKMKRFHDAEATVVRMVEKMHNLNPAEKDAFGRTKRSSAKSGKVPAGVLGALVCNFQGVEFEIGTGFDDAMRRDFWSKSEDLAGRLVTFKYQELSKDGVPRFPVFVGFRYDL
jgi:DNA ligase-1